MCCRVSNLHFVKNKDDEVFETLKKRIGSRLTELRKNKGYTSYEIFAFDHDISRMQYWRIEKGMANLTLKTLMKLLTIHKITIEDFFNSLSSSGKRHK